MTDNRYNFGEGRRHNALLTQNDFAFPIIELWAKFDNYDHYFQYKDTPQGLRPPVINEEYDMQNNFDHRWDFREACNFLAEVVGLWRDRFPTMMQDFRNYVLEDPRYRHVGMAEQNEDEELVRDVENMYHESGGTDDFMAERFGM